MWMISKHCWDYMWQSMFSEDFVQGYDPMLEISPRCKPGKAVLEKHTSQASAGCLMTGGVV